MAISGLVPHEYYSVNRFIKAVSSKRESFQPGAVLEIITEDQQFNEKDKQQKVTFVFQNWSMRSATTKACIIDVPDNALLGACFTNYGSYDRVLGITGIRFSGKGLPIEKSDRCWFSPQNDLFKPDFTAKTITYVAKDILSFSLPDMPVVIIDMIWQYMCRGKSYLYCRLACTSCSSQQ